MSNAVIVSGVRTAVGSFGGSLKDVPAKDLGALVIREALVRAGLKPVVPAHAKEDAPDTAKNEGLCPVEEQYAAWPDGLKEIAVDEVIMGNVIGAGQGQNVGRQSMIRAGLPKETTAITVNKVCASGMKAIALAAATIKAGDNEVVIAGGMENMSDVPVGLPKARWGHRMDMPFGKTVDLMVFDALYEIFYGYHMGITAENIAARYNISRKEQDQLSLESHTRALNAIKNGLLKGEIAPVTIPQRKGDPVVFDTDERPMETSMEKLARLGTAFKKDGTVTAGNASGINDAAAALLIMSETRAREAGLQPLARITGYASGGVDPAYMGLGPVPAVRKLLRITGTSIKDYDLFELNEAFAAQAIACLRELNIPWEITNVNGSAISIGHPVGCSGARIVLALVNEMKRRNVRRGLASLCIGGGQGMAIAVEAV
ncbi:MAG TPA: acetyl-CoA C-acetyltransferase [Smithellaceae bacterium]|jgi:acetyl-CoA C-acetyltransferase|nr:acetyl-CoA C-acetyltransferase [Syntrophaceae bacterium]HPV48285.1 acetyl-CoA C-acetyltransferase [Smithellaceae bacterium]